MRLADTAMSLTLTCNLDLSIILIIDLKNNVYKMYMVKYIKNKISTFETSYLLSFCFFLLLTKTSSLDRIFAGSSLSKFQSIQYRGQGRKPINTRGEQIHSRIEKSYSFLFFFPCHNNTKHRHNII